MGYILTPILTFILIMVCISIPMWITKPALSFRIDELRGKCLTMYMNDRDVSKYISKWNDPANFLAKGVIDSCVVNVLRESGK